MELKKIAIYGGSGLGLAAFLLVLGMMGGVVGSFGPDNADQTNTPEQNQTLEPPKNADVVAWDEGYKVPLDVKAPVASDLQVDIVTTSVQAEDGDGMRGDYGNYVDFNRSNLVQGWTQGVEYFTASASSAKTVTFPKETGLKSGNYTAVVTETNNSDEYHPLFIDVSVPSEIDERKWDNAIHETIVETSDFMRKAAYDSDSITLPDVDYANRDGATDLATSAYDDGDNTFEVVRNVDYQHGVDLLGEVDLQSYSGNITSLEVTVTSDSGDGQIYSETIVDNGEKTDVDTEFAEDMNSNPDKAKGDLKVVYEVTFEGSQVSAGEELFSAQIMDIYGNAVGTAGATSLTA